MSVEVELVQGWGERDPRSPSVLLQLSEETVQLLCDGHLAWEQKGTVRSSMVESRWLCPGYQGWAGFLEVNQWCLAHGGRTG